MTWDELEYLVRSDPDFALRDLMDSFFDYEGDMEAQIVEWVNLLYGAWTHDCGGSIVVLFRPNERAEKRVCVHLTIAEEPLVYSSASAPLSRILSPSIFRDRNAQLRVLILLAMFSEVEATRAAEDVSGYGLLHSHYRWEHFAKSCVHRATLTTATLRKAVHQWVSVGMN